MDYHVTPSGSLNGQVQCPADKSITQRAILLASLAEGQSTLAPFTPSQDNLATLRACQALGVNAWQEPQHLVIDGLNRTLQPSSEVISCQNSATGCRLLAGILSAQPFESVLDGDRSLRARPMNRIIEPLSQLGADIQSDNGHCPLRINGKPGLRGAALDITIQSAQIKSSVLFAGLFAEGETHVTQAPTRDHTERLLQQVGYPIKVDGNRVSLLGQQPIAASEFLIPNDFSAAAFFILAATISPSADITLPSIGVNPRRLGFLNVLSAMGANLKLHRPRYLANEPVADIRVRSASLTGVKVDPRLVSDMVDEFPCLAIAAACAEGSTEFRGATELRVKESDRITALTEGLTQLGIKVESFADGMRIHGGQLTGGTVECYSDHRIAMAFAVAGSRAQAPLTIKNCDMVATSFPGFVNCARSVGLQVEESS